jgi:hypothetical protein
MKIRYSTPYLNDATPGSSGVGYNLCLLIVFMLLSLNAPAQVRLDSAKETSDAVQQIESGHPLPTSSTVPINMIIGMKTGETRLSPVAPIQEARLVRWLEFEIASISNASST